MQGTVEPIPIIQYMYIFTFKGGKMVIEASASESTPTFVSQRRFCHWFGYSS